MVSAGAKKRRLGMAEPKKDQESTISGDGKPSDGQAVGDRHFELLAGWTAMAVLALFLCVVGTLVLAWCASKRNPPRDDGTAGSHVCHEGQCGSANPRHPPRPPRDNGDLTLVVNVVGGAVSQQTQPATPPTCPECRPPEKTGEAGAGGKDLIVVVDKEKVVERVLDKETVVTKEKVETKEIVQPQAPAREPPKACEQPVGRVRFEPGRCRVRFDRQEVLDIADRLQEGSGTVLVVAHPDRGNGERQAERRAKKVGKALRKALKGRTRPQLPVLTQAASAKQAGAGESETCPKVHYGTAGVYLIEGLH